jgi:putative salt-induced outer membrane protein YdiY
MALQVALTANALADVLVGINGERFVGKIIEESADKVVFESEISGRFTVPRNRIRELQKTSPTPNADLTVTNAVSTSTTATNTAWLPPGVGTDGFDWIQLKSGEWLKGYLHYVQEKKVQFESDKLEDLTLKLKDIKEIHSGKPMFAKFNGPDQIYGSVVLSNDMVEVVGPKQVKLPREQLTGITPGGEREIEFWSGKLSVGINFQSGNTKQTTFNASAELARRTPATQFIIDYLGNVSEVNGQQNANNHRVNLSYDVRLNKDWFLRPVQAEYYRDQLANIEHRITGGVGVGYYLYDRDDLEWTVAAGPGYQYTRFVTSAPGEPDSASTPAGILQTRFKADITSRWTFEQNFTATVTSDRAGLYAHHAVSTLEFEIKRYLDLDLSFVWDYLQNPQPESSGLLPKRSDLRVTIGVGAKF